MNNKSNILYALFYSFLYAIEALLIQGICVNVSAFYDGFTSGWITLFTFMLSSGALALYVLLCILVKKKQTNDKIRLYTTFITSILLTLYAFTTNIQVGCMVLVIHVLFCFLSYKQKQLHFLVWLVTILICAYGFAQGMQMSKCLTLLFSEAALLPYIQEKKFVQQLQIQDKKHCIVLTIMHTVLNVAVLYTLYRFEVHMIHVVQEQQIYNPVREYIPITIGILVASVLYFVITKYKVKIQETYITSRISFSITILLLAILFYKASFILSLVLILIGCAYMALEAIQLYFYDIHMYAIYHIVLDVLLCVVLAISQSLYDGIYVDVSVVLMSVLMVFGMKSCISITNIMPRSIKE